MKERIVIIFIAVTLGLIVTTFGFFLYTNSKPSNITQKTFNTNTFLPTPSEERILLAVDTPIHESVTEQRTIIVKGKTNPENILLISTNQEDTIAVPTSQGTFNATISIDTGINQIITRAIAPDGRQASEVRTVSFLPKDF